MKPFIIMFGVFGWIIAIAKGIEYAFAFSSNFAWMLIYFTLGQIIIMITTWLCTVID